MNQMERDAALDWVDRHFSWIMPADESDWTVEKSSPRPDSFVCAGAFAVW